MNMDILRKRLEIWKYILFINIGAAFILLVEAVLSYQETQTLIFQTSWYGAWLIVQLASFLPGFVLLLGKHWMQIPLLERLNTIFGYFAVVWSMLLPIGLELEPYTPKTFNLIWLVGGIALAIGYYWLRRKSMGVQNEIFP
ncbi:MAG: hypothetical protein ACM33V_09690 [Chloroflexota bacterium]|nr:hypothetical protein [Anaerolineales bacterium]